MSTRRRRAIAAGALIAVVAAGLVVARVLPDSTSTAAVTATDVAGDALYAVATYTAAVVLLPRGRRVALALAAGGWCIGVELLQLTRVPLILAERVPVVALVLGTGFDARDLIVYVMAVAAAFAVDAAVTARLLPGENAAAGSVPRE